MDQKTTTTVRELVDNNNNNTFIARQLYNKKPNYETTKYKLQFIINNHEARLSCCMVIFFLILSRVFHSSLYSQLATFKVQTRRK